MAVECSERALAERIRRALERGDPLELVAEANAFLEECGLGRAIVVGGYAVELYSGGAYRTGDVDVVVRGRGLAEESVLDRRVEGKSVGPQGP